MCVPITSSFRSNAVRSIQVQPHLRQAAAAATNLPQLHDPVAAYYEEPCGSHMLLLSPSRPTAIPKKEKKNMNGNMMIAEAEREKAAEEAEAEPEPTRTKSKQRRRRRRKPQKPGLTAKMNERHFVVHDYHDHEADTRLLGVPNFESYRYPCTTALEGTATTKNRTFPIKLHAVLEQADACGFSHVISWSPHGRCFMIHQPQPFVRQVMPHYFHQTTKLTSFQRQLNLYGFSRLTRGADAGGYYHELFLRHRVHLCTRMTRTKVKGTKFKAASSPDSEPNFYEMSPVLPLIHKEIISRTLTPTQPQQQALTPPQPSPPQQQSPKQQPMRLTNLPLPPLMTTSSAPPPSVLKYNPGGSGSSSSLVPSYYCYKYGGDGGGGGEEEEEEAETRMIKSSSPSCWGVPLSSVSNDNKDGQQEKILSGDEEEDRDTSIDGFFLNDLCLLTKPENTFINGWVSSSCSNGNSNGGGLEDGSGCGNCELCCCVIEDYPLHQEEAHLLGSCSLAVADESEYFTISLER